MAEEAHQEVVIVIDTMIDAAAATVDVTITAALLEDMTTVTNDEAMAVADAKEMTAMVADALTDTKVAVAADVTTTELAVNEEVVATTENDVMTVIEAMAQVHLHATMYHPHESRMAAAAVEVITAVTTDMAEDKRILQQRI